MGDLVEINSHRKLAVFVLYAGIPPYDDSNIIYITRSPADFFEAIRAHMGLMVDGIANNTMLSYNIATRMMSPAQITKIIEANKKVAADKLDMSTKAPDSIEPAVLYLVKDDNDTDLPTA